MRTLAVFAVALIAAGCSPSGTGPVSFRSPAGWTGKHQTTAGIDFYSVTTGASGPGLLMFAPWPNPSRPEDIPTLVQQLAEGFPKEAKRSGVALASERYRIEQFTGSHCQGTYAMFQIGAAGTTI